MKFLKKVFFTVSGSTLLRENVFIRVLVDPDFLLALKPGEKKIENCPPSFVIIHIGRLFNYHFQFPIQMDNWSVIWDCALLWQVELCSHTLIYEI